MWAIYGARLGCKMAVLTNWDANQIADYEWFKNFFYNEVAPAFDIRCDQQCAYTKLSWNSIQLKDAISRLGTELNEEINEMMLFNPTVETSKFFKKTYVSPRRWGAMVREADIQKLLEKGIL
jgi:hypothetical protein